MADIIRPDGLIRQVAAAALHAAGALCRVTSKPSVPDSNSPSLDCMVISLRYIGWREPFRFAIQMDASNTCRRHGPTKLHRMREIKYILYVRRIANRTEVAIIAR